MKRLAQLAASLALVTSSCADPPPDSSTLSVYSISGAVSGATAAVTVNLTGAKSATTMTDASGRYVFSALPSGTYTATPSLEGHVFSPAGRAVMVGEPNVNVTGQDFAGTSSAAAIHGISGNVTDQASGAGLANVVLHVSGASTSSAATGPSGSYEFSGLPDGSYTVTPSLAGYVFSPASIGISVNSGDVAGQNFVAAASTYGISGTISGAVASGITVTLSGASSAITVTDSSGNYAFTVANGSFTVTPALAGYVFSPASVAIPVNGGDVAGQSFTASVLQPPAALASELRASTTTPNVGEGVTMTLHLANADNAAAADVTAVTPVSSASMVCPATALASTPVRIAGGATETFTWTCTATAQCNYTLSATVSATDVNAGTGVATSVTGISGMVMRIVYQWWNSAAGDHFYTLDASSDLAPLGYAEEGPMFRMYPAGTPGTTPFLRFWSSTASDHFYTASAVEGEQATGLGYTSEGNIGNIGTSTLPGSIALHRYWNGAIGDHFYTTDSAALDSAYQSEGIAGYVVPYP
jgi:hypothetical protein